VKQLAFLENATIRASSIQIVCTRGPFASLAVLDTDRVEVIADEIYLGGATTVEDDDNIVLGYKEEIYYGNELAREGVEKIIRQAKEKLRNSFQTCHSSAPRFPKF
jgi:hypothetical protein